MQVYLLRLRKGGGEGLSSQCLLVSHRVSQLGSPGNMSGTSTRQGVSQSSLSEGRGLPSEPEAELSTGLPAAQPLERRTPRYSLTVYIHRLPPHHLDSPFLPKSQATLPPFNLSQRVFPMPQAPAPCDLATRLLYYPVSPGARCKLSSPGLDSGTSHRLSTLQMLGV